MQKFAGTIPMAPQGRDSDTCWAYPPTATSSIWQGKRQQPPHSSRLGVEELAWQAWQKNDAYSPHPEVRDTHHRVSSLSPPPDSSDSLMTSRTLYMGNLEAWMDHEYVGQVVHLMGWDRAPSSQSTSTSSTAAPVTIKIPPPPQDISPQPNNPGYCLLTFPSLSHAASVVASVPSTQMGDNTNAKDGSGTGLGDGANGRSGSGLMLMPNSSRFFHLQWATTTQVSLANAMTSNNIVGYSNERSLSVSSNTAATGVDNMRPGSSLSYPLISGTHNGQGHAHPHHEQGQQREHSIFVGDLAPETSNSDLVAVFRNPVLGLRNDREPKFIRPFYSCKSAKIMLDPVTGISRGYGFVRFTDEADQQRALIEMHGLYCLSRPMRVSPATAKFKPNGVVIPPVMDQPSIPLNIIPPAYDDEIASNRPCMVRSVSSPVAAASLSIGAATNGTASVSSSPVNGTLGAPTGKDKADHTSQQGLQQSLQQSVEQISPRLIAQIKRIAETPQPFSNSSLSSLSSAYTPNAFGSNALSHGTVGSISPGFHDEAWTHQAQARAILGNLIGPNGEQLTSTDPYNTTVFVGGLSPLISEETLRTFFAPFGDIHYVKVPVGKHCGFVQFVRKADAERAIERMQGFPIGGSRIRLSWGRSQYKAAQAAAQAAQSAQTEQTARLLTGMLSGQSLASLQITQEQAMHILQTLGYANQSFNTLQQGSISSSAFQGSNIQAMENTYDMSPDDTTLPVNTQIERPQYRASFSAFSSSYGENGAFQANDLLRNDSHSRFSGISSYSQDSASPLRFQPQSRVPQGFPPPRDDGVLQDLNGTLASLDLGGEPYMARSAVDRGDNVFSSKDIFGERRLRNTSSKQPAGT